jgi:hypothetical protein
MEEQIEQQVTRGLAPQSAPHYSAPKQYPFPTEVISLPSKGLCYPESHPLSKGEITIKLMTAKEEDILTSTNLIKKGIHLDKLLESVVVEPGVNVNDILVGQVQQQTASDAAGDKVRNDVPVKSTPPVDKAAAAAAVGVDPNTINDQGQAPAI